VWGAQGGDNGDVGATNTRGKGGKGGYSYGFSLLNSNEALFISVGGSGKKGLSGQIVQGGWNGGGNGIPEGSNFLWGSGGGCTSIQKTLRGNGLLKNYESVRNTDVLIVGGGGGGAGRDWQYAKKSDGGSGGGIKGGDGEYTNDGYLYTGYGQGGTQNNGGLGETIRNKNETNAQARVGDASGTFGAGGLYNENNVDAHGAGGGGGWYGGGAGYASGQAAGGGSGYIGGVSNGSTTNGVQTGNGRALITWMPVL